MCVSVKACVAGMRSGIEWLLICWIEDILWTMRVVNQVFVTRVTCKHFIHRHTIWVQVFRETVYSKLKNRASEKTVTMARMSFALVKGCTQLDLHN